MGVARVAQMQQPASWVNTHSAAGAAFYRGFGGGVADESCTMYHLVDDLNLYFFINKINYLI